ncbi:MAG: fructose bisphosphate aldolase [Alphaproteobacteria bacterium]|jgi:fructose-bisphosphate aldolase class I|nr:fructose bisphosphate aldolase [Alphaproteobacteria bacterium]|tara:strand:- start:7 stop:894 length:888 start_codon:yes stop_codon:yes gene_type:complete
MNSEQLEKIRTGSGFIAALDQSGGSTPKALKAYGIEESQYNGDDEMFDRIHEMRTRIVTSQSFSGSRILGAILFENTMDRSIDGMSSSDYLWSIKGVVPFLKVDKGLADEQHGVQVMKPIDGLDGLLDKASENNIFGTKMRSVIKSADEDGINAVVDQQFEIGNRILQAGLMPIIEPEVDIHSPEKSACEGLMRDAIMRNLELLSGGDAVMLKLTLPEEDNFYSGLVESEKILRVVALSGGYSREEANARMSRNSGVVASFSRALTEGLSAQQSQSDFDSLLDSSIQSIFDASNT